MNGHGCAANASFDFFKAEFNIEVTIFKSCCFEFLVRAFFVS